MKFSEAMKALEDGEVVKREDKNSFYAKRGGQTIRLTVLVSSLTGVKLTTTLPATFKCYDVDADDWAIAANPPKEIAEAFADIETEEETPEAPEPPETEGEPK